MKLFVRAIFLFLLPLGIMILVFVISDPFKIFFYQPSIEKNNSFGADNDFHTTNDLLTFRKKKKYNSFVLGNSRCTAFLPSHLNEMKAGARFYNYGTPGESVLNIYMKIILIEELGIKVQNLIILLDDNIMKNTGNSYYDEKGVEYLHHPYTSENTFLSYYSKTFKAYWQDFYFVRDLDYKLTGKYREYMKGYIPDPKAPNAIPEGYEFPSRPNAGEMSNQLITAEDLVLLKEIRTVLNDDVEYRIIIPPLYNQEIFNLENLEELQSIFGVDNVFNYSGINFFTNPPANFYEESHFKVEVADSIIQQIYQ